MKTKIIVCIITLILIVVSYIAWEYDCLWAKTIVCLYVCVSSLEVVRQTVFMSEERQGLKKLLRHIEKDIITKATLSSENMQELGKFRTLFGLKLRKSFFSMFK